MDRPERGRFRARGNAGAGKSVRIRVGPPEIRLGPQQDEGDLPDMRGYAQEMQAMLRQRSPDAYRAFLVRWRQMHEGNAADRISKMDDAALRLRIERMILDTAALSDLHDSAREYIAQNG